MEKNFQKIKFDIVLIKWDDSVADDFSWKSVDSALEWNEDLFSFVYSIGFLIDNSDEYVLLSLSVMPLAEDAGDKDTNVHGVFRIPKSSILEMKILVKGENI
jgi:hypothetical protein